MSTPLATQPVRVWDLPTRVFHWLLALCIVGLVITGKVGGNALVWHMRLGLMVFTLLAFRLVWGLIGGRWSRFASFVFAPGTVLRYLRGQQRPGEHLDVGHNPMGAGSVFALLAVLMAQVGTGLLADDEIATTGPLNKFVANATGLLATGWHKGYGLWLLMALVALHLSAIAYYRWRGVNLVRPMLTGDKALPPGVPASRDTWATRLLALAVLAACVAAAGWVWRQGG
jgi:cytochrome b